MTRGVDLTEPRRGAVWPGRLAEAIVLGMVCAAPWMFGATEAWAEFLLMLGAGAPAAGTD